MSHLIKLIGKRIERLTHEVSRTFPISSTKPSDDFDLYLSILFEENYTLNIYNNHSLTNASSLQEFESDVLVKVEEVNSEIIFYFEKRSIKVDMSDSGYTGPEAMSLYGPNDLKVVWS